MIYPHSKQAPGDVAAHYDTLDQFYREIWGEHVHHGYWRTGHETPEAAAAALVELVADRLDLVPGHVVCDIGCGYGATAHMLAETHDVAVSMAGRTRLYPARDASASSDVGLPRFDASGEVSKIDGVM